MSAMTAPEGRLSGAKPAAAAGQWLPILAFAVAAVIAAALLAQYVHAMATTSLWNDEYYTVLAFSTKGPWVAWTDYHVPNNHILYNILNSFWPVTIAFEPVPARLLSFVATGVAFILTGWFAVRERAWGGGILALFLLADIQTLDLTLQARGYGFAMLAAIAQAVATARYLQDGARGWLVAAAAAAFAGAATLPNYVLLAAPLALGLLILRPRRDVLLVLGATAILGLAFYGPTAAQVLAAAATYSADWGTDYGTVDAVRRTFLFVFPDDIAGLASALAIAAVLAFAVVGGAPHRRAFLILYVAALALFFAACLAMATPLVRTTQFAAATLPVLVIAASGAAGLGTGRLSLAGNVLLAAVAVPLAVAGVERLRDLGFIPIEAWRTAAHVVEAVVPPGMPVHVTFRTAQFAVYLDDPARLVEAFDEAAFRRGDLVVVDSSFREDVRFAGADHAPGAIDIVVPQRRGARQVVSFVPSRVPLAARAPGATPADLARLGDGDVASGWRGRRRAALTLTAEPACDRLVVLGTGPGFADGVDIRIGPRGNREDAGERVFRFERLAVVDLRGIAPGPVRIAPRDEAQALEIAEAWCVAPGGGPGAP